MTLDLPFVTFRIVLGAMWPPGPHSGLFCWQWWNCRVAKTNKRHKQLHFSYIYIKKKRESSGRRPKRRQKMRLVFSGACFSSHECVCPAVTKRALPLFNAGDDGLFNAGLWDFHAAGGRRSWSPGHEVVTLKTPWNSTQTHRINTNTLLTHGSQFLLVRGHTDHILYADKSYFAGRKMHDKRIYSPQIQSCDCLSSLGIFYIDFYHAA